MVMFMTQRLMFVNYIDFDFETCVIIVLHGPVPYKFGPLKLSTLSRRACNLLGQEIY